MKKAFSLLSACLLVLLFAATAMISAGAATPRATIINALKETVSQEFLNEYLVTAENMLDQLELTADQAAKVVANIEAADKAIGGKYQALNKYTAKQREAVLAELDKACETLNVRYEIKTGEGAQKNSTKVVFYKKSGQKLGEVDSDAVKKTDVTNEVTVELAVLSIVLMAGAVAAMAYGKKAVVSR